MKYKDIEIEYEGDKVNAREYEITYKGKPEKVVARRMGWAEQNSFKSKYFDIQLIGDIPKMTPRPFEMKTGALCECIVSAPFKSNGKKLTAKDLDRAGEPRLLENLYNNINEFNSVDSETKKKLPESSEEQEKENPPKSKIKTS